MTFDNYTYDSRDPTGRHEWIMKDTDISIANALRRVMLTDITNMAFRGEEATPDGTTETPSVEILNNTGPLHNEIITHRIGMVPIHFTAEEIATGPDGWRFELDVSASQGKKANVTTHDFKVYKNDNHLPQSETERLFPANKVSGNPLLIARLREGESLKLKAVPVLSTAREHAGFSPVSLCTYRFMVDNEAASQITNILDKERAFVKNQYGDPTSIQFAVESEVALTPKQIMAMAFDVIIGKLERVTNAISNSEIDAGYLTIRESLNGMAGFEFVFLNEDYTLGNLLQSLIYNETIRKGDQQPHPKLSYVGFCCPHPLDPTMVLRLVIEGEQEAKSVDAYKSILKTHTDKIYDKLVALKTEWLDFAPK